VYVAAAAAALLIVFLFGPEVRFVERWVEPPLPADLDSYLEQAEASVPDLRSDDGKGIVWADPGARARTPLSLVYLHGFSADRHEIEPLVSELGRELGANVFFARLTGHGRDEAALGEATVEAWLDDVAEAVAVGGAIGERIVVLGTSTGATLALWAATRDEVKDRLAALVLLSPNLGLRNRAATVLLWPWGGLIARLIEGPERCFAPKNEEQERHWTTCYPTRALQPMMAVVDRVRRLPRGAVEVPTLALYAPGDTIVDTGEIERILPRLTAGGAEIEILEGSGDPAQHVLAGAIMSPETTDAVRMRIREFVRALELLPGP